MIRTDSYWITLSDNITIRPYQEGDEEELVELLELAFNGWPNFDLSCTPLEHWQWKYRDNPQNKMIILLSKIDGKIVSCQHHILCRLKIGNTIDLCSIGVDVAVHPDYRGKGMRKAVREHYGIREKNGVKSAYTILMHPYALRYQQREQQRSIRLHSYELSLLTKIRDIDSFLLTHQTKYSLLKKWAFRLSSLGNHLQMTFSQSLNDLPIVNDFKIGEIKMFDDRINDFWNEIKDDYDFIIERNKDYLNWRYCDPRGGEYKVEIAEKRNEIQGYIVLRIKKQESEEKTNKMGYIVDLLVQPDRLDIADSFLNDAVNHFDEKEVNVVQALMIRNHRFEKIFRKHGFLNSRIKFSMFQKYFNEEIKIVDMSPERIHIQYGDTDWI